MKVFIDKNKLIKEEEIDKYNIWRVRHGLPYVDPPFIEVPDDFDIKDFENGIFSQDLYDARKEMEKEKRYENRVEWYIRQKYSLNAELAILRQRYVKLQEFDEYNSYVEECKEKAKREVYGK